jgi:hypothetical protein
MCLRETRCVLLLLPFSLCLSGMLKPYARRIHESSSPLLMIFPPPPPTHTPSPLFPPSLLPNTDAEDKCPSSGLGAACLHFAWSGRSCHIDKILRDALKPSKDTLKVPMRISDGLWQRQNSQKYSLPVAALMIMYARVLTFENFCQQHRSLAEAASQFAAAASCARSSVHHPAFYQGKSLPLSFTPSLARALSLWPPPPLPPSPSPTHSLCCPIFLEFALKCACACACA